MRAVCVNRGGSFAAIACAALLSGCNYLIQSAVEPIAQHQAKRLKLPTSHAAAFSTCLQSAGGECRVPGNLADALSSTPSRATPRPLDTTTAAPRVTLLGEDGRRIPGNQALDTAPTRKDGTRITVQELQMLQTGAIAANNARSVLNSGVQQKLNDIFNAARGARVSGQTGDQAGAAAGIPSIAIDLGEFTKYLDQVEEVTSSDGWDALARQGPFSDASDDDLIRRQYIAAYFKAYFRNGKFYSVKLNGDELKKKVVAKLKESIPGIPSVAGKDPYDELAGKLFSELKFDKQNQHFIGKVATESFITRGGQEVKFPAVEAELFLASGKVQANKLDYVAVGSDLIRVLLHATYDAHDRIPGVSNATGYSVAKPLGANDPAVTNVDENELGEIESRAAKIETTVSAGIGRVVRGLGIIALNNEALATAIETAVGVAARKHTEKIMWCWTACKLNEPRTGDFAPSVPDEVSLDITITGQPTRITGVATPAK